MNTLSFCNYLSNNLSCCKSAQYDIYKNVIDQLIIFKSYEKTR